MSQADVTVACVFAFLCDALLSQSWMNYPGLAALAARCEALPEFLATRVPFHPPAQGLSTEPDRPGAAH
jgi:hypothetical protein